MEGKKTKERIIIIKKKRECEKDIFSNVARQKICSHTRTQWKKSLTWMIAADQLVGREVSFSKSGFQFPKGAYRVPMEYNPSSENLPRARAVSVSAILAPRFPPTSRNFRLK